MTLRRQLLLVSLLLLSLPWAGCQFLREMESAMRQGQENALQATAQAIATVVAAQPDLLYPYPARRQAQSADNKALYAFTSAGTIIVDGYGDGWENTRGVTFTSSDDPSLKMRVYARVHQGQLYLLLKIRDHNVSYHHPGLAETSNGDRVILRLGSGSGRAVEDYRISTAAPGQVSARPLSRSARSQEAAEIHGFWQDAESGYTLELTLPLSIIRGRLGVAVIDDRGAQPASLVHTGNFNPSSSEAPPWLISANESARQLIAPFVGNVSKNDSDIILLDKFGWRMASSMASTPGPRGADEPFWLLQWLYRTILSSDQLQPPPGAVLPGQLAGTEVDAALTGKTESARYRSPDDSNLSIQSVAVPVRDGDSTIGAVVLRQSGESYLSLTDQAFSRLLGYSLAALALASLGLLGYASLLSWRIRQLSRAVNNAIGDDGAVVGDFTASSTADEIGELSRHYGTLLGRVRDYNEYLRSLSRKLSHELRTPVAVIRSSLDNLEHASASPEQASAYRQRAREGLARLQNILTAMSEANQLEESILGEQLQVMELAPLLSTVWAAYADAYPGPCFDQQLPSDESQARIAPELLIQALDKLVDNAASYCPDGARITLELHSKDKHWLISVSNDGPTLPPELDGQLFEPMVSRREAGSEQVHLGLGLHIVKLIAEFHQGKALAQNRADGKGVVVSLVLPKA